VVLAAGGALADALVRPGGVVVLLILGQDGTQVRRAEDQHLCVPITSSTSCDQVIFVDQATDVSVFSDAVLVEVDRFE
jgi:hypothetical protein